MTIHAEYKKTMADNNTNRGVYTMNGILKKLMLAMLLILVASPVFAATSTTIGKVVTTPTGTGIWVSAAYTGDDTTPNNTLTIIYKPSTVTLWSSGTSTNLTHAPSPYRLKIQPLTNGTAYDVRVQFNDPEGVFSSGSSTILDFMRVIPSQMMHNSDNATNGAIKWSASGWGIPGGKYEQFECGTCHKPRATNIKSVNTVIATPNNTNWGSVSSPTVTVVFQSVGATNGFGDDSNSHTTSQKICEVCHSQTDYHRYNASTGQTSTDHYNTQDCASSCHQHQGGFGYKGGGGGACSDCHGTTPSSYWITELSKGGGGTPGNAPGAHVKHYGTTGWPGGGTYDDSNSQTIVGSYYVFSCGKCHKPYGSMQNPPNPDITLTGSSLPPSSGGSYTANVCSNVYCHGAFANSGGTKINLAWTTTLNCTTSPCHGSTATTYTSPNAGAHQRHVVSGTYGANQGLKLPCMDCHGANQGNIGHVNGSVSWDLNTAKNQFGSGAVYNGQPAGQTNAIAPSTSYSQCNNVYCHSTVQNNTGTGLGTYKPVTWGTTPVNCDSCHGDANKGTGQPVTGSHWRHAATAGYNCDVCHLNFGDEHPQHANYLIDSGISPTYYGTGNWSTYSQSTHTPGLNGYGNCSNVYCHGSYVSSNGTNTRPIWGGTAACGTCHLATSANPPSTGNHRRHAGAWTTAMQLACTKCHGPGNGIGTIGHMNLRVDWRFETSDNRIGASAKYRGASIGSTGNKAPSNPFGSCTSVYCHSTVQSDGGNLAGVTYATADWGSTSVSCGSCHGAGNTDGRPATGKHAKHAGTTELNYPCSTCHFGAGDETVYHARGTINLAINTILYGSTAYYNQGNAGPGTGYGRCFNVYCHGGYPNSSGTNTNPFWTTVGGPGMTCGSCHLATSANPPSTGSHRKHAGAWTTSMNLPCQSCHGPGNGIGTIGHVDLKVQWRFDTADTKFSWFTTGTYRSAVSGSTGTKAGGTNFGACTNLYCHSNVQANGGNAGPTSYSSPVWGSSGTAQCGSCHIVPANTGGHTPHLRVYGTVNNASCSICHFGAGDETPYHARGTINLRIGTTYWANLTTAAYSQGDHKSAGGAYGFCSNTTCHGGPSRIWNSITNNHQCTKCHGNDWTSNATYSLYKSAPGADQTGHDNWNSTGAYSGRVSNSPVVGAHDAHLRALSTISLPVSCNQCHLVPATVMSAGHNNTGRRAEITWGTWANWVTNNPAAYWTSNALTQCTNIYCHGAKMPKGDTSGSNRAPSWTSGSYLRNVVWQTVQDGGCGTCHGSPPPSGSGTSGHAGTELFPSSCTGCHPHVANNGSFTTVSLHMDGIVQGSGDCTGCHSGAPKTKSIGSASGATIRQIVGTGGDFNMQTSMTGANGMRHLFGANTITKWDCTVCHLEGWYSTAGTSSFHKDSQGLVDLRNVDLANDTGWKVDNKKWTSSTAVPNLGWWTNSYANMDNFCVSCHDANGAVAAYVNSTNSGLGGGTSRALTPFNTSDTRGGKIVGSTEHLAAGRSRVIDIKSAFYAGTAGPGPSYNGNPSQHAVLGQRYSTVNARWGTATGGAWTSLWLRKMNNNIGTVRDTAVLSCADCHILDAGSGAHAGAYVYDLWVTMGREGCWRCHGTAVYSGAGARAGVSRSNHSVLDASRTVMGASVVYGMASNSCMHCHANWVGPTGDTQTTVSRQAAYGGIHGNTWGTTQAWYTSPGGRRTGYRFVPGTWMKPTPPTDGGWNSTTTGNCYFQTASSVQGFGECNSHSGGNETGTPTYNYGRPTNY